MKAKFAIAAAALSVSGANAEIVRYFSYLDDGTTMRPTDTVPYSDGFFGIELEYDTTTQQIVYAYFSDFPRDAFVAGVDTILDFSTENQTYILLSSADGFHEVQLVLEGRLENGGRLDFVLHDPAALANGEFLQDATSLLRFEAPNWGTAYLSFPFIPTLRESGGPRQSDFDEFPGFSYYLYTDPISQSCNAADIAEPTGVLDLTDIDAFVVAFSATDSAADIAAPFGVIDLGDIDAFIASFFAGCP